MCHGIAKLQTKERKHYLEARGLINCGYCRYNRGENKKHRGRSDRHKNIDRASVRRDMVALVLISELVTREMEGLL